MKHRTKLIDHLFHQFGKHCKPVRSALDVARVLEARGLITRLNPMRYQETDRMRELPAFPGDVLELLNKGDL